MPKTQTNNIYINSALRIVVGLVFMASAVLKYLTVDSFDMYIYEHQIFGYVATETLNRCLIAAEFCLGVFMIAGIFLRFTKYTMLAFLVAFTAYLLLQPYLFDVDGENCHCFGDFLSLNRWQSVLKNIVLIALVFPVNPALRWHFRWPKTGFAALAVLSLAAVFSLITPSYIDTALYGKEITIDGSLFRTTMSETEGGESLLQGRKVVCFYSTSCGYCRKAAKKVHIAMENANIDDNDVQIVFWHTNPDKPIEEFFEKSGVPPLQYVEIPTTTFLNITNGVMPLIAFVNDGTVTECHKYIELNEKQMNDFLTEK